jgi:hypothetical protein
VSGNEPDCPEIRETIQEKINPLPDTVMSGYFAMSKLQLLSTNRFELNCSLPHAYSDIYKRAFNYDVFSVTLEKHGADPQGGKCT